MTELPETKDIPVITGLLWFALVLFGLIFYAGIWKVIEVIRGLF